MQDVIAALRKVLTQLCSMFLCDYTKELPITIYEGPNVASYLSENGIAIMLPADYSCTIPSYTLQSKIVASRPRCGL